MTYRLYYSPGACSMAVHIALEELGARFELELVSTQHGDTQRPAYLAVNPKGRVPALGIPGEPKVLTEVPAILLYLARTHTGLLPQDALGQARCLEWLAWLTGWVHGVGYGGLWRPGRFVGDEEVYPAVQANGRRVVQEAYLRIEQQLAAAGPWALPQGYSIVDPFLLVLYRWGNRIELSMRDDYPTWSALTARMLERPAVQKVLQREGLGTDA